MDHVFPQLILASVLLVAGVTDLRSSKIPNWLTMSAMAGGLLGHSLINGLSGLLFSVKGLGLGLAIFLVLYIIGGMGAGDVKLLAAVGSFVGAEGVFSAGMMAMVLGGLYAIVMMMSHGGVRASLKQMATILQSWILMPGPVAAWTPPAKAQPQLRYALVIGLGTLLSQWMATPLFTF
jgi:prepilin peptidase CpaA